VILAAGRACIIDGHSRIALTSADGALGRGEGGEEVGRPVVLAPGTAWPVVALIEVPHGLRPVDHTVRATARATKTKQLPPKGPHAAPDRQRRPGGLPTPQAGGLGPLQRAGADERRDVLPLAPANRGPVPGDRERGCGRWTPLQGPHGGFGRVRRHRPSRQYWRTVTP